MNIYKQIFKEIKKYNTIVIARHIGADPDALGAQFSLKNIILRLFPDKKVYGLIGGFHLFNKSEAEIREFAGKIRDTGIEYICTGHCTKDRAFGILKEELGDIVCQMQVGLQIVI